METKLSNAQRLLFLQNWIEFFKVKLWRGDIVVGMNLYHLTPKFIKMPCKNQLF